MKKSSKKMLTMAIIFLLMIVASLTIGSSYIKQNNINIEELFRDSVNLDIDSINSYNNIFTSNKASQFNTISKSQSDNYNLTSNLFISTTVEEVTFVEENRNDIMVDYHLEYPDSSLYNHRVSITSKNDQLSIVSTFKVGNMAVNQEYNNYITIHVPEGYVFDSITMDSSLTVIDPDNIYTKTNNLYLIANYGDVELTIDYPLENLELTADFGSIDLNINDKIKNLTVTCDMGDINIDSQNTIGTITISNDFGNFDFDFDQPVKAMIVNCDLGSIEGTFRDYVAAVNITANLGSIDIKFHNNDDMLVFVKADLVDVSSDFLRSNSKTDYVFVSDLGSINLSN